MKYKKIFVLGLAGDRAGSVINKINITRRQCLESSEGGRQLSTSH